MEPRVAKTNAPCLSREARRHGFICSVGYFLCLLEASRKQFPMLSPDDVFRPAAESDEGIGKIAEGSSEFTAALKAVLDKVLELAVRPGWVCGV